MTPRDLAKILLRAAATVAVGPVLLLHAMKVPILGKDRALAGSTQLLALVPGLTGQYFRRAFLVWTIRDCHPSALVEFGTIFSKAEASLGENVYIGPYCSIGAAEIGRDTLIGPGVHLLSGARLHGTADPTTPIREQAGEVVRVSIGAGCWIGAGAVVMADIGQDSIVGAGAVVTRPIPSGVVAVGMPARVIRGRAEVPAPSIPE